MPGVVVQFDMIVEVDVKRVKRSASFSGHSYRTAAPSFTSVVVVLALHLNRNTYHTYRRLHSVRCS